MNNTNFNFNVNNATTVKVGGNSFMMAIPLSHSDSLKMMNFDPNDVPKFNSKNNFLKNKCKLTVNMFETVYLTFIGELSDFMMTEYKNPNYLSFNEHQKNVLCYNLTLHLLHMFLIGKFHINADITYYIAVMHDVKSMQYIKFENPEYEEFQSVLLKNINLIYNPTNN